MSRRQARHDKFDGPTVLRRRSELQLTQEDLAREIGVTLRTVQRWEHGANAPNGLQLLGLARVLELDPDEFYLEQLPAA